MVKKIAYILSSFLLLLATSGTTISLHFCKGNFVSIAIDHETDSCCGGACGNCENKIVHFAIEDDYTNPLQVDLAHSYIEVIAVPLYVIFIPTADFANRATVDSIYSPPPPLANGNKLAFLQTYLI